MEIIRNFIRICGIASGDELPSGINGAIIQYSENETVFIPDSKKGISGIFQIILQVDLHPGRIVHTPYGSTVILDGIKRLKILCSGTGEKDQAEFLDLEMPYNTFVELPGSMDAVFDVRVYIMDAYFSLLDNKRIYSHILYLVHLDFPDKPAPELNECKGSVRMLYVGDEGDTGIREKDPDSVVGVNSKLTEENSEELLIDIDEEYL